MFMAVALPSLYTDSLLQKNIPVVKALMTNNRKTCPPVLRDWRETHTSRDLSVMYLIDFILCLTSS
jgi:hypothetical protein